jgi:hypothetical protein
MTVPLRRQYLAAVAAVLRDGTPLDADDAALIADVLNQIAVGVAPDVAFGLRRQRADTLAAIKARDCILREAARTMPGLPLTEAAKRIHIVMLRYRETA